MEEAVLIHIVQKVSYSKFFTIPPCMSTCSPWLHQQLISIHSLSKLFISLYTVGKSPLSLSSFKGSKLHSYQYILVRQIFQFWCHLCGYSPHSFFFLCLSSWRPYSFTKYHPQHIQCSYLFSSHVYPGSERSFLYYLQSYMCHDIQYLCICACVGGGPGQ